MTTRQRQRTGTKRRACSDEGEARTWESDQGLGEEGFLMPLL